MMTLWRLRRLKRERQYPCYFSNIFQSTYSHLDFKIIMKFERTSLKSMSWQKVIGGNWMIDIEIMITRNGRFTRQCKTRWFEIIDTIENDALKRLHDYTVITNTSSDVWKNFIDETHTIRSRKKKSKYCLHGTEGKKRGQHLWKWSLTWPVSYKLRKSSAKGGGGGEGEHDYPSNFIFPARAVIHHDPAIQSVLWIISDLC